MAVTRLLDDAAAAFPTSPALEYAGTAMDYRDLRELVNRRAAGLVSLGLRRGQRVVVLLPNCPAHVVAALAVLRAGGVLVEVDPLAPPERVAHVLRDCAPHIVICLDMTWAVVERARTGTSVEHVVVTSLADALPRAERVRARLPLGAARARAAELRASVPSAVRRLEQVRADDPVRVDRELDPHRDLAVVHYPEGGSSPRGVRLTHAALVANAYQVRLWRVDAVPGREAVLAVLPLFHLFGLVAGLLSTMLVAGRVVLVTAADPEQVLVAMRATRPVFFPGVPALFRALLDAPEFTASDLRSVRAAVSTAGKVPHPLRERFRAETGTSLLDAYGLPEAGGCTHCSPLGTPAARPGTVGLPLTGTAMRVVDLADPTRPVPPGERGQLAVRGPQLFDGYWNGADAADLLTQDGFLLTGDLACMDGDGYLTVLDPLAETMDPALPPSAVEAVLQQMDGIRDAAVDVAGTAYVVRADPDSGEPTEQQIRARVREEFAEGGVPPGVAFVGALPRDRLGLVRREELSSAAREDANHSAARRDEIEESLTPEAGAREESAPTQVDVDTVAHEAPAEPSDDQSTAAPAETPATYGFVPDPQQPERLIAYQLPTDGTLAFRAAAPRQPDTAAGLRSAWTRILRGLDRRRPDRTPAEALTTGGPSATTPLEVRDDSALVRVVRPEAEPLQDPAALAGPVESAGQPALAAQPRRRPPTVDSLHKSTDGRAASDPLAIPAERGRRTPRPRTSKTAGTAVTSTAATPAPGTSFRSTATPAGRSGSTRSGGTTTGDAAAEVTAETGSPEANTATPSVAKAAGSTGSKPTGRTAPKKALAKAPATKAATPPGMRAVKASATKQARSSGTKATAKTAAATRVQTENTATRATRDPTVQDAAAQAGRPDAAVTEPGPAAGRRPRPRTSSPPLRPTPARTGPSSVSQEPATTRLRRGGTPSSPAGPAKSEPSPGGDLPARDEPARDQSASDQPRLEVPDQGEAE